MALSEHWLSPLAPSRSRVSRCTMLPPEPLGEAMRRRDFIKAMVGSAVLWPPAAYAQQSAMPVVGFLSGRSLASDSNLVTVFSQALSEAGYVNGQNVAIEFRWADGQLGRLPELAAQLIERKVTVI